MVLVAEVAQEVGKINAVNRGVSSVEDSLRIAEERINTLVRDKR